MLRYMVHMKTLMVILIIENRRNNNLNELFFAGGFTSDSLIDMSGGIQDTLSIRDLRTEQERSNIWHLIVKSRQLKSITAAFLEPDPRIKEDRLTNGLVLGKYSTHHSFLNN